MVFSPILLVTPALSLDSHKTLLLHLHQVTLNVAQYGVVAASQHTSLKDKLTTNYQAKSNMSNGNEDIVTCELDCCTLVQSVSVGLKAV